MAQDRPIIALLGAPALLRNGESQPLQISEKTLALLALFVCNAGRPIARAWIASKLWPDVDEAEARANLRRHLYNLTKALPPIDGDYLVLTKNTAQWNANAGCRCDVIEFTEALEAGRYEAAVAAYGGPLCVGIFDDAVLEQRERLERMYVQTLLKRKDTVDPAQRLMLLERLASHDPLNESWVRELAQTRLDAGDRAGARRELSALASRLRAELGVEPEAETVRMLVQCMERDDARVAGNLPVETTSLVGREPALDELSQRLASEHWITIVGPGGIGKTRLAIHAARTKRGEFEDGAWFVDLAPISSWSDALRRIAAVLSLTLESEDASGALNAYLASRRILLVLDNLEQLGEEAAAGIAHLSANAGTRLLATSRRRLGGAEEHLYHLQQLAVPPATVSPADALQYSAVRLFVERAVAVAPAFALSHENAAHVASIVRKLDGLPLAIELVAARANLLTIEGIAKRIGDLDAFRQKTRDERHQTVTAAVRWSYDLLTAREQLLLQRLAVFEGPFDLAAVESICTDEAHLGLSDAFPILSELLEASLVSTVADEQTGEQRYALLETVRQFVNALPGNVADKLRDAHAQYFANRARETEQAYDAIGTAEYVRLLRRDEADIESAMRYAWKKRDATLLGTFVVCFVRLWPPAEMTRRAELFEYCASQAAAGAWTPQLRARVLTALGAFASTQSDWARCKSFRLQAAALFRECGEEAEALMLDAMVVYVDNYLGASLADVTVPALYAIVERLQAIGADDWYTARIYYNLASMEFALGRPDTALPLALSALATVRRERRVNYIAACLTTLSKLYLAKKDFALAQRCVDESLDLLEDPSYAVLRAQALGDRGRILLAMNRVPEALRAIAQSLATFERAFEFRFVVRTLTAAMEAMLHLGLKEGAGHIAGYVLAVSASTGTVAATFEASEAYRATRAALGDAFDTCVQLGATFTFAGIVAEVQEAAAAHEDDSRTMRSV